MEDVDPDPGGKKPQINPKPEQCIAKVRTVET